MLPGGPVQNIGLSAGNRFLGSLKGLQIRALCGVCGDGRKAGRVSNSITV